MIYIIGFLYFATTNTDATQGGQVRKIIPQLLYSPLDKSTESDQEHELVIELKKYIQEKPLLVFTDQTSNYVDTDNDTGQLIKRQKIEFSQGGNHSFSFDF